MNRMAGSIRLVQIAFVAALSIGAVLRLLWLDDIEYKLDEAWTFRDCQRFVENGEFARYGMPSSQNILNPAMSAWIFYPVGWLFGTKEPTNLALGVAISSILAILLLVGFAFRFVKAEEREIWLWAAALSALNPHFILVSRKIWPPCLCPVLTVGFLAGWWKRDTRLGAFTWGLLGVIAIQIHLSACFYTLAIFLAVLFFNRTGVRWKAWLAGNILGSVLMIPWIGYLVDRQPAPRDDVAQIHRAVHVRFWSYWCTEPFALGLDHYVGDEMTDFLAGPTLGDKPTFLDGAAYSLCFLIAAGLIFASLRRWWQSVNRFEPASDQVRSQTRFLLYSACLVYGVVLWVSCLPIHRHYLMIAFPLTFVWVAWLALPKGAAADVLWRGRAALAGLCLCSMLLSWQLLSYIHHQQYGPSTYGKTYRTLVREQQKCPPDPGPPFVRTEPKRSLPFRIP
jgi:hypothetical protein